MVFWKFWFWIGFVQVGFVGLVYVNLLWWVMFFIDNGVNYVIYSFFGWFGMDDFNQSYEIIGFDFSVWLKVFIIMFLVVVVVFVVCLFFIKMVYVWCQFRQIWEVVYIVNLVVILFFIFVVVVVSVLWFVFFGVLVLVGFVMLGVFGVMCQFFGELFFYIGVNKIGGFFLYFCFLFVLYVIGIGFYVVVVVVFWLFCGMVGRGIML